MNIKSKSYRSKLEMNELIKDSSVVDTRDVKESQIKSCDSDDQLVKESREISFLIHDSVMRSPKTIISQAFKKNFLYYDETLEGYYVTIQYCSYISILKLNLLDKDEIQSKTVENFNNFHALQLFLTDEFNGEAKLNQIAHQESNESQCDSKVHELEFIKESLKSEIKTNKELKGLLSEMLKMIDQEDIPKLKRISQEINLNNVLNPVKSKTVEYSDKDRSRFVSKVNEEFDKTYHQQLSRIEKYYNKREHMLLSQNSPRECNFLLKSFFLEKDEDKNLKKKILNQSCLSDEELNFKGFTETSKVAIFNSINYIGEQEAAIEKSRRQSTNYVYKKKEQLTPFEKRRIKMNSKKEEDFNRTLRSKLFSVK